MRKEGKEGEELSVKLGEGKKQEGSRGEDRRGWRGWRGWRSLKEMLRSFSGSYSYFGLLQESVYML